MYIPKIFMKVWTSNSSLSWVDFKKVEAYIVNERSGDFCYLYAPGAMRFRKLGNKLFPILFGE